jgi:hypothetical protein
MKALISLNEEIKYISSWTDKKTPIFTIIGKRVCEVSENEFPVAEPLFWIDCNNDINASNYYYDEITKSILIIPEEALNPIYLEPQPKTSGTQTI